MSHDPVCGFQSRVHIKHKRSGLAELCGVDSFRLVHLGKWRQQIIAQRCLKLQVSVFPQVNQVNCSAVC